MRLAVQDLLCLRFRLHQFRQGSVENFRKHQHVILLREETCFAQYPRVRREPARLAFRLVDESIEAGFRKQLRLPVGDLCPSGYIAAWERTEEDDARHLNLVPATGVKRPGD